jgi:hypothetical protein
MNNGRSLTMDMLNAPCASRSSAETPKYSLKKVATWKPSPSRNLSANTRDAEASSTGASGAGLMTRRHGSTATREGPPIGVLRPRQLLLTLRGY